MQSMRTRLATALWLLSTLAGKVLSWPSYQSCDYDCLAALKPSDDFNHMDIPKYGATIGDDCVITTDVPATGYAPGKDYTTVVTAKIAMGYILGSDKPVFDGQASANTDHSKMVAFTKSWTATADASISFRSTCGSGGSTDEMWIAAAVSVNLDPAAPTIKPVVKTTTTSTVGKAQPPASAPAGELAATIELSPGLKMGAVTTDSNVDIIVESNRNAWVGLGFSKGTTVSMTGDGQGVDLYACTSGAVMRYWMTTKNAPSGGVPVAGSSCSHVSGKTTMRFQRTLNGGAGRRLSSVAITPGTGQIVIYAQGENGKTTWHHHAMDDRGGKTIDFATLEVSEAKKKSAEATLYLHLIFMTLSWGALLPWGVALANRTRRVPGAAKGSWFKLHTRFQYTGWFLQLVGFAMAIWHCSENSVHFDGPHTWIGLFVVVLGTLQPLNAFVRPHTPQPGEAKAAVRLIWEIVHKGSGYVCILLGMLNVFFGVALLNEKEYDGASIVVALVLGLLGAVPVLGYTLLSLVMPNNGLSRLCVGGTNNGGDAGVPSKLDEKDAEISAVVVGQSADEKTN